VQHVASTWIQVIQTQITLRRIRSSHGKAISISYSECEFLALVIQHAKHMHHIILSSVACLALPYISALSYKLYDFVKKKVFELKMCVLTFSETFVRNISYCKKNSVRYYHKVT